MECETNAKTFAYDQLKFAKEVRRVELKKLRKALRRGLRSDTLEAEESRTNLRVKEFHVWREREEQRQLLLPDYEGYEQILDDELVNRGYPVIVEAEQLAPEVDMTMSYLLTQVEMENSLATDYGSIVDATKSMAVELQAGIEAFDEKEKTVTLYSYYYYYCNFNWSYFIYD